MRIFTSSKNQNLDKFIFQEKIGNYHVPNLYCVSILHKTTIIYIPTKQYNVPLFRFHVNSR